MVRVHIELQRVQTWLFAVPRLRAMVGANALLGKVLRIDLPTLARQTGAWSLAPVTGDYPLAHEQDPLKEHDDPATDAGQGILSRDGGHFEALFASGADAFADAAGQLLRRELPRLRFCVWIDRTEQQQSRVHLSTDLPVLAPCEWTGRGLASKIIKQGDDERPAMSLDIAKRHDAARPANDTPPVDLASLLSRRTTLNSLMPAQELKDLVGSGYLALIHADGNNVGKSKPGDEVGDARFFHHNRVLLRRALQKAIDAVIGKHTIPIHRLHEVAEQLAGSAKRRFRGLAEGKQRSVVDWAVYTTAWVDEPEEVRRRDWLRGRPQLPELKASTADKYATMLDLHILPALGDFFIDAIMPADVLKWRDAQDAKPGTVNTRLRVLRTLLADAASDVDLPRNPAQRTHAVRDRRDRDADPNTATSPSA